MSGLPKNSSAGIPGGELCGERTALLFGHRSDHRCNVLNIHHIVWQDTNSQLFKKYKIQHLSRSPGGKEQEHELQGTWIWWPESPASLIHSFNCNRRWDPSLERIVTLLVELVTRITLQVAICFSIVRLNTLKWRVWFSFFLAWERAGRPWSIDPPQSTRQPKRSRG